MYWAQFHKTDLSGKMAEGVGDRAVIILDGRESLAHRHSIAKEECKKRGYEAFTLAKGSAFSRPVATSKLHRV